MPVECTGKAPPTWQVGVAVSGFRTFIDFADDARVEVAQQGVSASVGHFATARFGWTVTATAIVNGDIDHRPVDGGGAISGSVAWLWLRETARRPFVALGGTVGTSLVRGTADDASKRWWSATDLRGGVMAGKTLATRFVPYAAVRVFGGPVMWRRAGARTWGGDRYHVSAGLGLTIRLPGQIDLAAEVMPLGEQSATIGVTAHR